ncbi:MAG: alkene reductase [Gammaproteobacteria bacterium]
MEQRQPLLTSVKLGPYTLPNRVVMAPMTRSRADNPELAPTELHAKYYAQRAGAGLIVTEASPISPQGAGYIHTPGIYSMTQIRGWREVTDAVHERGGHIFIQLWHVGRISHPDFHDGELPVAPSALNPNVQSFTPAGFKDTVTPRALTTREVRDVVQDFVRAAENAMQAGFDGIELHGANGYLIEQFLRDSSNYRDDVYGGSIAKRARFLFQIVDGVGAAIGRERVGVRLSPGNVSNIGADSDMAALYDFVIGVLDNQPLAYLHLIDPGKATKDDTNTIDDITQRYRTVYGGTLITNGGHDRESGNAILTSGDADLVAYGRPFIANPDLARRFQLAAPLASPDLETAYRGGAHGYVDYPALQCEAA